MEIIDQEIFTHVDLGKLLFRCTTQYIIVLFCIQNKIMDQRSQEIFTHIDLGNLHDIMANAIF